MPTAIISIYTKEGFVIMADGLDCDQDTYKVNRDSVQKIYPIKYRDDTLACSFTGTDRIQANGSADVTYDFVRETVASAALMADTRFDDLINYVEALKQRLIQIPESARKALSTYDSARQETTIFVEGYFDGRPRRTALTIPHDGRPPDLSGGPATAGMPVGAYSMKVRDAALNPASPLAKYRSEWSDIRTLDDARESAWRLMAALLDPEAHKIDSKCKAMGGWTHMATITPADGFRWVKKPL